MPHLHIPGCVSRHTRILLLAVCLMYAGGLAGAHDAYDITDSFYFPLIVNRTYVGDIEVGFDTSYEPVFLKVADLYPHLAIRLKEEFTESFRDDEWVTLDILRENRIPIIYDPSSLIFEISVIPETARIVTLSLKQPPAERYGQIVEPAEFSFYTNIYTEYALLASYGETVTDFTFNSLILDPNITFRDWVLESRFSFSHDSTSVLSYSGGMARLVRYRPEVHTRLTIGDLHSQLISGSGARGIFFEKNYSLGYSRTVNSSYALPLIMREPAEVSIRLNERSLFDDLLTQGQYAFNDFSFLPGINTLEVTRKKLEGDESITTIYNIPFDNALLPKGSTEYSAGITIPASVSLDAFRSDPWGNINLFGYAKAGLSHRLSAAYLFSIGRDAQYHRTILNAATLQGNYAWNTQVSYQGTSAFLASDLAYSFFDRSTNRSFGITGGFDTQATSLSFSGSYSQGLFDNFGFNTQVRLNFNWESELLTITPESTIRNRLSLSKTTSLVTQMTVRWLPNDFNVRGSVYLSTSFSNNQVTASVRQTGDYTLGSDANTFKTYVLASYRPKTDGPMGSVTMSLTEFSPSTKLPGTFTLGTSYANRYLSSSIAQTARFNQESVRFTFGLSTALAYADANLVLTRPISNSFALVKAEDMLKGYPISINPGSSRHKTMTNASGVAVYGGLTSFQSASIVLDPLELPPEIYFTDDQFRLTAGYKQAFVIRPGAEGRVFLTGRIFLDIDKPLRYGFGEIKEIDEVSEEEPQFIFTDDTGRFFAYELRPGKYTLTLYLPDRIELIEINIPPDLMGAASVGDIILSIPPEDTHTVIESEEYRDLFLTGKIMIDQQTTGRFLSGSVRRDAQEIPFTSDAQGNFVVYDITPGMYDLSVFYNMDVERFTIVFPDIKQGGATLGTIYLIESYVSDQEGTIETRAPLSGRIQFSDGVPYAHGYAEVYCEADELSELVHFVTDEQGRFIIYDVRPGVYILTLSLGNRYYYLRLIVPDDITPAGMTTGIIEVSFASTEVDRTIRQFPSFRDISEPDGNEEMHTVSLSGRIMFDASTPGAFISGVLEAYERTIAFTTDSQGMFFFSSLLPGLHTMTVLHGPVSEVFDIFIPPGAGSAVTVNSIILSDAAPEAGGELIPVSGAVRYHDGTPYAGRIGEAVMAGQDREHTSYFITDSQGRFSFSAVQPGMYTFTFELGGSLYSLTEELIKTDSASGALSIAIDLPQAGRVE